MIKYIIIWISDSLYASRTVNAKAPTCGQCGVRMQLDQFDRGRLSQTEDVYGQLRAALLSGRYLPDQKLKISELCGDVRGSLGAVREALSRLLAEGLVVSESY